METYLCGPTILKHGVCSMVDISIVTSLKKWFSFFQQLLLPIVFDWGWNIMPTPFLLCWVLSGLNMCSSYMHCHSLSEFICTSTPLSRKCFFVKSSTSSALYNLSVLFHIDPKACGQQYIKGIKGTSFRTKHFKISHSQPVSSCCSLC